MFTGLIADVGTVTSREHSPEGARLHIGTRLADELQAGDSIAVGGVCLTATEVGEGGFAAEAMAETLARSSLGDLREGARVNLELPLRASDRLGGHVVQGHVDGVGRLESVRPDGDWVLYRFRGPRVLAPYLVEKGSIAVDGVSLTVFACREAGFAVALIPHTLAQTTLGERQPGDRVNLEADVLLKHIESMLRARR